MSKLDTMLKDAAVGRESTFIYGPSGSGKTYAVLSTMKELVAKGKLDEVIKITMSPGVEDVDLITKLVPNPKGGFTERSGYLRRVFELAASEKTVGVLIDEINRATPRATNLVLTAIDPVEGEYVLNDFVRGDVIRVPLENIWWVATANLGGAYTGTSQLDEALLDRFQRTVFWGYDQALEKQITKNHEKALAMAKALRTAYLDGKLKSPFSTRHLSAFVRRLEKGGNPVKVAEETFLYRLVGQDVYGFPDTTEVNLVKVIVKKAFEDAGGE